MKKFGVNDPDLDKLWGFDAMEVDLFYKFLKEKQIKPTRKAKIAIIDTGVDSKHKDLKDNFVSTVACFLECQSIRVMFRKRKTPVTDFLLTMQ